MKCINFGKIFAAIVIIATLSQSLIADTLAIPDQTQSSTISIELPARGMTMIIVKDRFGEPNSKGDTIGTPPITVWRYPDYSVYFEHEYVIHAVVGKS